MPRLAVVLAAGLGTRLGGLAAGEPKVLAPVAGRPLLDYTLRWLAEEGVREVALNLHHLGSRVRDAVGDGSGFGLRIHYSEEPELLGTAGALRPLSALLDDTFLLIYGDVLTRLSLGPLVHRHRESDALATVALHRHDRPWEKGVVELEGGYIHAFVEKPDPAAVSSDLVNAGVYVLEPDVLGFLPETDFADFGRDLFPALLSAGEPVAGHVLDQYLLDIGTPEAYVEAQAAARDLWPGLAAAPA
ncbi:MAG: nucleotidyltransferase family protein [Candidatus Dormibacteria bacterium]